MNGLPGQSNGSRIPSWLVTGLIVLITWIFSAGVNYEWGVVKYQETDRRIGVLEENEKRFVTQQEYDRDNAATNTWLNRIEQKIDEILERGR